MCGLWFWSALFFSPFSYIPTCHPLLRVRVLSFFRQSFTECVSVLGFSSKANFQDLRELFVCISFPGTIRVHKKKKKANLGLLFLECSERDVCSRVHVSVHPLVSCKQKRNSWQCLKFLPCCGTGLTDNHCQAFTQHSKVTFPLYLRSSIHIQPRMGI